MSRLPYVKPTILQHVNSLANKFGRGPSRRCLERIDGVAVSELIERFGSPLFVFSEHRLRQRYREAHRAFALRYPKVQFAWSYKTNYLDAVCRVFHEEGAWAEVVSEVEYEMARNNGIPPEHILFNGPYKPAPALKSALLEGAKVHVDHYDELYAIEQIAREAGRKIGVTLRVNMDTGIQPRWDRFGFNLDSGEAMDAIRRLISGGLSDIDALGRRTLRTADGRAISTVFSDHRYTTVLDYQGPRDTLLGLFSLGMARAPYLDEAELRWEDTPSATPFVAPLARLGHELVLPFATVGAVPTTAHIVRRGPLVELVCELDVAAVRGAGRLPDRVAITFAAGLGPVSLTAWRDGAPCVQAEVLS